MTDRTPTTVTDSNRDASSPLAPPMPPPAPPRRSLVVPLVLGAAMIVLAILAIERSRRSLPEQVVDPALATTTPDGEPLGRKLADYWELGDFSLVDQRGQPFTKASLGGKIWVFDFVYTTCPGPCLVLTAKMKSLVAAFSTESDVEFASVSVDPETDTPPTLARFASSNGADSPRWHFLTGTKEQVTALRTEIFKDSKGGKELHSTRIYVVDRDAHLRAIHDTQIEDEWKVPVVHSVRLLLEQQKKK